MDSTKQDSAYQTAFEFGQEDFPVRTCRLPDDVRDWLEADLVSGSSSIDLLQAASRNGWSSRTSPDYSVPMKGETLQSYLEDLPESYRKFLQEVGEMRDSQEAHSTPLPTAFAMHSFMEWPSAAVVCSLSAVLETDAPRKYYLSARAARGILRRAEKRGKALPEMLHRALLQVAERQNEPGRAEGKTPLWQPLPPFEEWIKATGHLGGTREEWERLKEMESPLVATTPAAPST